MVAIDLNCGVTLQLVITLIKAVHTGSALSATIECLPYEGQHSAEVS